MTGLAATSIRPLKKPSERQYLSRQIRVSKRAMCESLMALRSDLRRAGDLRHWFRRHPIAASALTFGAVAGTAALAYSFRKGAGERLESISEVRIGPAELDSRIEIRPRSKRQPTRLRPFRQALAGKLWKLLRSALITMVTARMVIGDSDGAAASD